MPSAAPTTRRGAAARPRRSAAMGSVQSIICSDKDVNEKSKACQEYLKTILPQTIEAEFNRMG